MSIIWVTRKKRFSLLSRPNVVACVVRWRSRVNGTFVGFDDDEEEDEDDDDSFFFFFFFFSIFLEAAAGAKKA